MTKLQPLSTMTFERALQPAKDIGSKGEQRWIPLDRLGIDPIYQRAVLKTGKANIGRMIEGFSWSLFGTLVVGAREGGMFAIIDGQHRATAALLHGGIKSVPCLVVTGGQKDEARAFSYINGNVTRIHALQSFRARVAAGDSDALEMAELCASAGVTIAPYPKNELSPGETFALGAVCMVMKKHGRAQLLAVLHLLRAADPDAGISAAAIIGTAWALHEKPDWRKDAKAIGERLAARGGARKLSDQAAQRKLTRGGAEWLNFSAVITGAIDMALRTTPAQLKQMMGRR
jgi:hypothetical protein